MYIKVKIEKREKGERKKRETAKDPELGKGGRQKQRSPQNSK